MYRWRGRLTTMHLNHLSIFCVNVCGHVNGKVWRQDDHIHETEIKGCIFWDTAVVLSVPSSGQKRPPYTRRVLREQKKRSFCVFPSKRGLPACQPVSPLCYIHVSPMMSCNSVYTSTIIEVVLTSSCVTHVEASTYERGVE